MSSSDEHYFAAHVEHSAERTGGVSAVLERAHDDDAVADAICWAIDPREDAPAPSPLTLLTLDEVAGVLRVSKKTVLRWIGRKKLEARACGSTYRVHPTAVRALLRGQ